MNNKLFYLKKNKNDYFNSIDDYSSRLFRPFKIVVLVLVCCIIHGIFRHCQLIHKKCQVIRLFFMRR